MPSIPPRLRRLGLAVRRAVLARRRILAALLAAVAALAGLRATTAPPPATVPVTVAARDLPAGATLSADDLTVVGFAPGSVPDDVTDRPAGARLASPVTRGEPITGPRLVGPRLVSAAPGLRAVPVRLPDAATVALLDAGDRIDLYATDPQGRGEPVLLASAAVVLAVPEGSEDHADAMPGRVIVVGVPGDAAVRIAASAVTSYLSYAFTG